MFHEDIALFLRKIVKCVCEIRPDQRPGKHLIRVLGRIEQDFPETQRAGPVILLRQATRRTAFPVPVDDPVPRDGEEPGRQVLDGFRDAVACDELIEDVLQDVFGVSLIADPPPDEIEESFPLRMNGIPDERVTILL